MLKDRPRAGGWVEQNRFFKSKMLPSQAREAWTNQTRSALRFELSVGPLSKVVCRLNVRLVSSHSKQYVFCSEVCSGQVNSAGRRVDSAREIDFFRPEGASRGPPWTIEWSQPTTGKRLANQATQHNAQPTNLSTSWLSFEAQPSPVLLYLPLSLLSTTLHFFTPSLDFRLFSFCSPFFL
jgi:hypothetical protein